MFHFPLFVCTHAQRQRARHDAQHAQHEVTRPHTRRTTDTTHSSCVTSCPMSTAPKILARILQKLYGADSSNNTRRERNIQSTKHNTTNRKRNTNNTFTSQTHKDMCLHVATRRSEDLRTTWGWVPSAVHRNLYRVWYTLFLNKRHFSKQTPGTSCPEQKAPLTYPLSNDEGIFVVCTLKHRQTPIRSARNDDGIFETKTPVRSSDMLRLIF